MTTSADDVTGPPPNYTRLGPLSTIYSNSDHVLDAEIEARCMSEAIAAPHAAWEFHGTVWYEPEPNQWHEVIRRYGSVVGHFTGPTALSVIEQAIAYGGSA